GLGGLLGVVPVPVPPVGRPRVALELAPALELPVARFGLAVRGVPVRLLLAGLVASAQQPADGEPGDGGDAQERPRPLAGESLGVLQQAVEAVLLHAPGGVPDALGGRLRVVAQRPGLLRSALREGADLVAEAAQRIADPVGLLRDLVAQ